jgi:arylformamidase
MIHDISPPITTRLGVWPGDTPPTREVLCDMAKGANITLSTLRSTVHLGAHADGPNHYSHPAPGIGERTLEHYLGPCHVLDAPVPRGSRVSERDVRWPAASGPASLRHPRVLLRTSTFPDPEHWNADFAALEPALVDLLASRGVTTVGIDTPSVDPQESKDLPAHAAFARHDMSIIEGLRLADIQPGEYELIALPLRLIGFDASPIRAVLRSLPK